MNATIEQDESTHLTTVLSYAARGWRIIPLWHPTLTGAAPTCACPKGAECPPKNIGKHPLFLDWPNAASTDTDVIRQWWGEHPLANIGIVTGNGLCCLDIDPRNGGDRQLDELIATYGPLPDTPMAQTGGGGQHYLFALPEDMPTIKLSSGIDFLAGRTSQFVAAPSLHRSGQRYTWELSSHPDDVPLAPLPAWIVAMVHSTDTLQTTAAAKLPDVLPTVPVESLRLPSRMLDIIRTGNDSKKPYPSRSEAVFAVMRALVKAGYDDATMAAVLLDSANGISEKPLEKTRGWVASEIARARGKGKGKKGQRIVPRMGAVSLQDAPGSTNGEGGVGEEGDPPWIDGKEKLPYSDYTNALAFVREHGQDVRYCYKWGKWLVWDGTYWDTDNPGAVMQCAKKTVKHLLARGSTLPEDKLFALMKHVKASLSTAKLKAMVENVQDEPGIAVEVDALDQHPWLLNCRNGTLDLQTGVLMSHDRSHLMTRRLDIDYDASALCPTWDRFLLDIMNHDTAMVAFLQRAIGYAATGIVRDHALFVLYGTGANGKSTFLNTLGRLMGEYALKAVSELLIASGDHDRHPTERADLFGKRLVCCIETEEGRRLDETFMKEATGDDPIRARRMREDFWEFMPTHHLFMATNHKPVIRGTDFAVWRRIKLIPFTVAIPEERQDKTLPERLKTEHAGILAWIVRGCLDWQRQGLAYPDAVMKATAAYRVEEDVLGSFLEECCVVPLSFSPSFLSMQTKFSALYQAYTQWCAQTGQRAVNHIKFGKSLTDRGFERFTNNGTRYRGIGLREKSTEGTEGTEGATEGLRASTGAATEGTEAVSGVDEYKTYHTRECREIPSVPSVPSVDVHPNTSLTPAAIAPCFVCHGTDFWPGAGGIPICQACHPQPSREV